SGDDVEKKIRALSGGEKTRLVMARMLLDPPNFLVLDEPTNHLDLATKEMLVKALGNFEGTMLFVSHYRAFLPCLSNRVLDLRCGTGTCQRPARPRPLPPLPLLSSSRQAQKTGSPPPRGTLRRRASATAVSGDSRMLPAT